MHVPATIGDFLSSSSWIAVLAKTTLLFSPASKEISQMNTYSIYSSIINDHEIWKNLLKKWFLTAGLCPKQVFFKGKSNAKYK